MQESSRIFETTALILVVILPQKRNRQVAALQDQEKSQLMVEANLNLRVQINRLAKLILALKNSRLKAVR